MPRRTLEVTPVIDPPRKKSRILSEAPSTEVSFCDDEALPPGIVFTDVLQNTWRIGKPIGRGSFGRIYLASNDISKEVSAQSARYVVKVEPHTNGPLFVEVHCLIRTAQADKVKTWRFQKKQKRIGMPVYIASGSFIDENTGVRYRFLVLPRYEVDLQKIIARNRVLDLKNVLILAVQILDVLEYLHEEGYTHSDIKSSNLMLGFDGGKLGKISMKTLSFQKDIKEVTVLSGKPKRPKKTKSRASNYYDDDDFVVEDYKSGSNSSGEESDDRKLKSLRRKLSRILSEKHNRTSHRHHAFNLRQLKNYVDYEDLNSSICSDHSYQKLLDIGSKNQLTYSSDEGFHEENFKPNKKITKLRTNTENLNDNDLVFKEAILSQSTGQIYLLDYGLASKFLDSDGNHKDFGMDARKAHDGTLEYSSRDSHIGAHSRRSDLETLGYNLLDWLTATLPWKTAEMLSEPDIVHVLKKNFMSDVKSLLKTCFKTDFYPKFMEKYLQYVTCLEFTEKPDYEYCRNIFRSEFIKKFGSEKEMSLQFIEPPMSPMKRKKLCYSNRFGRKNTPTDFVVKNGIKKAFERENICSLENGLKLELLKQTLNSSSDGVRKPCTSRNFFISDADIVARLKKSLMPQDVMGKKLSPKNLRSHKRNIPKKKGRRNHRSSIGKFGNFMGSARQFTWAEILAGNPEDIIRKERNNVESAAIDEFDETCKYRIRKLSDSSDSSNMDANLLSPLIQKDYLQGTNPTYAMKEVLSNFRKKMSGKTIKEQEIIENNLEGYTPAMIRLYRLKEKREANEKLQEMLIENNTAKLTTEPKCTRSRANHSKIDQKSLAIKKSFLKTRKASNTKQPVIIAQLPVEKELDEKYLVKEKKNKAKTSKMATNKRISVKEYSNASNNEHAAIVPEKKNLRSQTKKKQTNKKIPIVMVESVNLNSKCKETHQIKSRNAKKNKDYQIDDVSKNKTPEKTARYKKNTQGAKQSEKKSVQCKKKTFISTPTNKRRTRSSNRRMTTRAF